jgi:hypothetical protein
VTVLEARDLSADIHALRYELHRERGQDTGYVNGLLAELVEIVQIPRNGKRLHRPLSRRCILLTPPARPRNVLGTIEYIGCSGTEFISSPADSSSYRGNANADRAT